ncbi:UNVERIFIED_ORG: aminotransferase class V-fold PLP-dependent enzyme [Roseateles sp. XES5]|nr:aminotransferase class V-fold PLP-dependent enzyme [Roseateles sp. XES5]
MPYPHSIPPRGKPADDVLADLDAFQAREPDYIRGAMSAHAMRGGEDVQAVSRAAYLRYFSYNALVRRYFPGFLDLEAAVTGAVAALVSGGVDGVVTNLTSGGTESNFCAMHAAREWAKVHRPGVTAPEIVAPYTAHATLSKACHYLGLKLVRTPLGPDYRADVAAMAAAVGPNTIGFAVSAPQWPHGLYDPVADVGRLAVETGLWLHVDACVGGFIAPFVERAGHAVPAWDFRVDGVSSISADAHKYGYAAKPLSTISWRSAERQAFNHVFPDDWPCGPYMAPAFSGSRPAGSTASAWSLFQYLGEEGYTALAAKAMDAKKRFIEGIAAIDGLEPWETDLTILVFGSRNVPVQKIVAGMAARNWPMGGTLEPPLVHLVVDAMAAEAVDAFLQDLRETVARLEAGEAMAGGTLSYVD